MYVYVDCHIFRMSMGSATTIGRNQKTHKSFCHVYNRAFLSCLGSAIAMFNAIYPN